MTDERTDSLSQASQTPHSDTKDNREIDEMVDEIFEKGVEAYDWLRGAETASDVRYGDKLVAEAKTQLKTLISTQSNLLDTLLEAMPEKWSEEGHDWMETVGQYDALTEVETIIKEMQK